MKGKRFEQLTVIAQVLGWWLLFMLVLFYITVRL
jgi:hypothetical protein